MKRLALIAGALFLLLGIAGFVPGLAAGGMLFGVLPVNTMYSVIYVIAGLAGIMVGLAHRHDLIPPPGPHRDLRDLSGV
jgi:hypothetical protein